MREQIKESKERDRKRGVCSSYDLTTEKYGDEGKEKEKKRGRKRERVGRGLSSIEVNPFEL